MNRWFQILILFIFCSSLFLNAETNNSFYDLYLKGLKQYENCAYESSCNYFRAFLEKFPNANRGNVLFRDSFEKYQTLEVNLSLGQESFKKNEYGAALSFLKNVLEISPQNKKAWFYLNECYKGLKTRIKILDEPSADGDEIKDQTLSLDQELKLYAVGFDANNQFVGTVPVLWSSTSNLDKINETRLTESHIFSPVTLLTSGRVKATLGEGIFAQTGLLKVIPGRNIKSLKVCILPEIESKDQDSVRIKAGEELSLYAFGFDDDNKAVGPVPVQWQIKGLEKNFTINYTCVFKAVFKKAEKGNLIVISKNNVKKIIELEILPAEPYYLEIDTKPDGTGIEIFNMKLLTGNNYSYYACGYDRFGNFVENVKADWSSTPTLEPVDLKNTNEFIFNPTIYFVNGLLEAKKSGFLGDKTGTISVFRGTISEKNLKKMAQNIEKQNNIVYFVKKDETLSRIISNLLNLPYRWRAVYPYVYAVSDYNRIPDADLIFPNQPVYLPFVRITNTITKANLSGKLFNDKNKANMLVVYHTNANVINKMNKLILLDEYFLRTSNLDYLKEKYNFDFVK